MFRGVCLSLIVLPLSACVTAARPKPSAAFERATTAERNRLDFTDREVGRLAECFAASHGDDDFKIKCSTMFANEKLMVMVDEVEAAPEGSVVRASDGLGVAFTCRTAATAPRPALGAKVLISGTVRHFEENRDRKAGLTGPKETTTYVVDVQPCALN